MESQSDLLSGRFVQKYCRELQSLISIFERSNPVSFRICAMPVEIGTTGNEQYNTATGNEN
jgi:hypothetical protein